MTNNQSSLIDNQLKGFMQDTLHEIRDTDLRPSTSVENLLQISPFLPNKPNFRKAEIDASSVFTKDYENLWLFKSLKNKPNSNPNKANLRLIQIHSKPKQSQFKPNSFKGQN